MKSKYYIIKKKIFQHNQKKMKMKEQIKKEKTNIYLII